MKYAIDFFKTPNNTKENIRFRNLQNLTSTEAKIIRLEIAELLKTNFETIYLDVRDVTNVDLSGINEVIHSNYVLQHAAKNLVFVYRQNSIVEKWVNTTNLDLFVDTALLPSS